MDAGTRFAHSADIGTKIGLLLRKRGEHAVKDYSERVQGALGGQDAPAKLPALLAGANPWNAWQYTVDAMQRSILFWETMRQRGNEFVLSAVHGLQPALHFDYETVLDGRGFERPVNYALLRITPPEDVHVDDKRRPYLIIDPRAGHGPGIGGFKDDSQVGVALRAGHPVYFVIFFRDPEPGQTLLDVCTAEQRFVRKVRELHPDSPKPAIIGNCQGGWAAMMLSSSSPEDTGPIVINGAPMSYWGGAWSEGETPNPMRYSGGLLGGTWLSSMTADLGNGKFDGAWLVYNFENENPANTFWDKYYNLYANVDTEPPRFLEFEKWWGGFYLMNTEEIEWITQNLFVGNKLWSGDVKSAGGKAFDLREIRSPIVLFASMGDNITPPQQAFNWVADLYGSTAEIKARGQVIVGLLHKEVGHLGIFVSGKVAKKEHTQIVSVLQTIERLPPGLYGMDIKQGAADGGQEYEVEFRELQLEEVSARLNRFQREDEKPFEAVATLSEFNQRAYELFARPLVQAVSNEFSAELLRRFHPLRRQHWMLSDLNPWMAWLRPAADFVREHRRPVEAEHPLRQLEKTNSELLSASLDLYRATRDALTEASFFSVFANMHNIDRGGPQAEPAVTAEQRALPFVKEALATIAQGGYPEALARVDYLLSRKDEPLPLARLQTKDELMRDYAAYLPQLPPEQFRHIRGEQELIAHYAPEQAILTLPDLLADQADRTRLLALLDKLMADKRVQASRPSAEQLAMLESIRQVLGPVPAPAAAPIPAPSPASERRRQPPGATRTAGERRRHAAGAR